MQSLVTISQLLARFTAIVIILAAIIAMIEPASFSWVKGDVQILVLGTIMLGMGMTLGKEDYKILAQRPLDILVGTIAQYTIMPLLAIFIGRSLGLSDGLTLGLVLVGSCPGGVSSNIMSYLAKGDVAFSVGMTTISTLLAPITAPLWMMYLVGETVAMDGWGMFKFMLLVTLFPVLFGSAMNILLHKKSWFGDVKTSCLVWQCLLLRRLWAVWQRCMVVDFWSLLWLWWLPLLYITLGATCWAFSLAES